MTDVAKARTGVLGKRALETTAVGAAEHCTMQSIDVSVDRPIAHVKM